MKSSLLPFASSQNKNAVETVLTKARIWADHLLHKSQLPSNESAPSPQPKQPPKHRGLDPASLRFRLTVGVTAFSVLGIGGVAAWTGWKMQQILINTHNDNVKYIAEQFPRDVERYSELMSVDRSIAMAIDQAPPSLLLWIETNGSIVAQSDTLAAAPDSFVNRLLTLAKMPSEPRVYRIEQRYLVLCSSPLIVEGRTLGQLHLVQDITSDQLKLNGAVQGLSLVSVLSVIVMAIAIAVYIYRSLRPLRRMSQMAANISANDLSDAQMTLNDAPTEVKELADKLNEMLSRLAQAWEQQRQLIGDISHELRTPLSVAYGSLQCMQRRSASLNETQREMLDTSLTETHRTIQLLQSLLELARADNGCLYLRSEKLHLNAVVAHLVEMSERLHHHEIHLKAEQPDIWLSADRNSLNQVLTNLIDNAVKYSPADQPITIQLSQTDTETMIQIKDHGCGIPIDQQARIFDRFYRVDDARSRATGGVGLGLSIVKTLIDGMGGQIQVWSEPGAGSQFTITFPTQKG